MCTTYINDLLVPCPSHPRNYGVAPGYISRDKAPAALRLDGTHTFHGRHITHTYAGGNLHPYHLAAPVPTPSISIPHFEDDRTAAVPPRSILLKPRRGPSPRTGVEPLAAGARQR